MTGARSSGRLPCVSITSIRFKGTFSVDAAQAAATPLADVLRGAQTSF